MGAQKCPSQLTGPRTGGPETAQADCRPYIRASSFPWTEERECCELNYLRAHGGRPSRWLRPRCLLGKPGESLDWPEDVFFEHVHFGVQASPGGCPGLTPSERGLFSSRVKLQARGQLADLHRRQAGVFWRHVPPAHPSWALPKTFHTAAGSHIFSHRACTGFHAR